MAGAAHLSKQLLGSEAGRLFIFGDAVSTAAGTGAAGAGACAAGGSGVSSAAGGEQAAGAQQAQQHAEVTYAVAFKNRDVLEEAARQGAAAANTAGGAAAATVPTRAETIQALAGALHAELVAQFPGAKVSVNLKSPQLVLVCEVVPVGAQLYAALALLPAHMLTLKPRLQLKSCGSGSDK